MSSDTPQQHRDNKRKRKYVQVTTEAIQNQDATSKLILLAERNRKRELLESNLFLYGVLGSTSSKPPHFDKIFSTKDACDEKEAVLMQHWVSNLLAMVRYTSSHHHPHHYSSDTTAQHQYQQHNHNHNLQHQSPSQRQSKKHTIRQLGIGFASNTIQQQSSSVPLNVELDFMETLFYDCRRGRMTEECKKVTRYLDNEYFRPVNPSRKEGLTTVTAAVDQESSSGESDDDDDDEEVITEREKKRVRRMYDSTIGNCREKTHRMFEEGKQVRVNMIMETLNIIIEEIARTEDRAKEESKASIANIRNNLFYSLQDQAPLVTVNEGEEDDADMPSHRPASKQPTIEDVEKSMIIKEMTSRLNAELETLHYVNKCEESYVYLRYFMLCVIANEKAIQLVLKPKCNPKKFDNFPLYLRLLTLELANAPFNTHNLQFLIKGFIKDASLYYTNGIVKGGLFKSFFSHEEYKR